MPASGGIGGLEGQFRVAWGGRAWHLAGACLCYPLVVGECSCHPLVVSAPVIPQAVLLVLPGMMLPSGAPWHDAPEAPGAALSFMVEIRIGLHCC